MSPKLIYMKENTRLHTIENTASKWDFMLFQNVSSVIPLESIR